MSHQHEVRVNGLKLPEGLLAAISEHRWATIATARSLEQVFGSTPVRPKFFSLAEMRAINARWKDETDIVYIGRPDSSRRPGDIDPAKSLIIAELGPDELIALDFRWGDTPSIAFASDDAVSPWRIVAESIDELLNMIQSAES